MSAAREQISTAVQWLQTDDAERHYQAAMLLRIAAMDPQQNAVAHECGAVAALVGVLQHGPSHPVTLVALEALACLVTQNADGSGRAEFRDAEGPKRIVNLILEAPESDVAHRILLIFQVLADKEADRKSLVQSGVTEALKLFLNPQHCTEMTEHALSAVCNLAAGSQMVKQQMCNAGVIEPLLRFLTQSDDRTIAQLAALSVRNLSRDARCRQEIVRLDGVPVLLEFLSEGVENLVQTMTCEATYSMPKGERTRQCWMTIDVERGQLILSAEAKKGCCAAAPTAPKNLQKDASAERYSFMMKAMRFSMPSDNQLDLRFDVDKTGITPLGSKSASPLLLSVTIPECDAAEISELITKLLNKLYTQQDFKVSAPAVRRTQDYVDGDGMVAQTLADSGPAESSAPKSGKASPRDPEAMSLELAQPAVLNKM